MPSPPEIRLTLPLRWRDIDQLGHLNQSVYHELLEEARGALLLELAGGSGVVHHTYVLARVELDYRHEVRKDHGTVDITVRIGHVGTKSLRLDHDVLLPDGTVAATGSTVLVGWDMQTRGARVLSDVERERLGA